MESARLRTHIFRIAIGALALAGCAQLLACSEPSALDRPNVILIVVDTLRSDRLSHAGYPLPTAQGLDAFAAQATFFPNAYAPSPWTRPSTAALLTGQDPARLGILGIHAGLPEDATTLAEVLKREGWKTLGHSFNVTISQRSGMAQGFDSFEDVKSKAVDYPDIAQMMTRVRERLTALEPGPFLLFLQPMNTHGPYRTPRKHEQDLLGRAPADEFSYSQGPMRAIMAEAQLQLRDSIEPRVLVSLSEKYDTAIRYSTDRIGELFDFLDERGLYDSSMIILTSDHGEELFDHGGFSHGYSLHEEVLRVPLYVKLPQQNQAHVRQQRVSIMDVYPTILALLGIESTGSLDGRSLLPLLSESGEDASEERVLVHHVSWPKRCRGRAITAGRYRLVDIQENYEGLRDEVQLYDLKRDPTERNNLAGEHPQLVSRLRTLRDRIFLERQREAPLPPPLRFDADEQARLKALGYVD